MRILHAVPLRKTPTARVAAVAMLLATSTRSCRMSSERLLPHAPGRPALPAAPQGKAVGFKREREKTLPFHVRAPGGVAILNSYPADPPGSGFLAVLPPTA